MAPSSKWSNGLVPDEWQTVNRLADRRLVSLLLVSSSWFAISCCCCDSCSSIYAVQPGKKKFHLDPDAAVNPLTHLRDVKRHRKNMPSNHNRKRWIQLQNCLRRVAKIRWVFLVAISNMLLVPSQTANLCASSIFLSYSALMTAMGVIGVEHISVHKIRSCIST